MTDAEETQLRERVDRLTRRIEELERVMRPLRDIRIAPECGGGEVKYSSDNVTIIPESLRQ